MVNAWSLLYSQMNGTMDEDYPIMNKKEDESEVTMLGGESADTISADFPTGNVYAADTVDYNWWGDDVVGTTTASASLDTINFRTDGYPGSVKDSFLYGSAYDPITFGGSDTINLGYTHLPGGMGNDHISFDVGAGNTAWDGDPSWDPGLAHTHYHDPKYYATNVYSKPQPDLKSGSTQKYQEDKGIKDLKDYVASTYSGHYTNKNSDTQTLDLIHSVGDAESFCRSNAIKYLSRYDKKGQAKRDILKAMHYCLLLYYFSGNTQNEITTRGYETF